MHAALRLSQGYCDSVIPLHVATPMIQFATFPRTWSPPAWVGQMVDIFHRHESGISSDQPGGGLSSEEVLAVLAGDLERLGFHIERLKLTDRNVPRHPLSAGGCTAGSTVEHYHFDVYHPEWHCCIAIEDGPAWTIDTIDEDAVEPLLVANADTLCLAVPGGPGGTGNPSAGERSPASEYDRAYALAQAVYGRSRSYLPRRLMLIGY